MISELLGKTLVRIVVAKAMDTIHFETSTGEQYVMLHHNDCCENVNIEDIAGDLGNLIGSPITKAEESTNNDNPKSDGHESHTWTFYHLATVDGYVTIRWYGESNGYYSESVDFEKVESNDSN